MNSNNIKTNHLVYLLVLWVFHATLHLSSNENLKSSMFDTFWTFDFIPSTIKVEIFSFLLFSIENSKNYPMCIVVKQNWYSIIQIWHLIWTSKNDRAKMYGIEFDKQMHHFMCVNGFKWKKWMKKLTSNMKLSCKPHWSKSSHTCYKSIQFISCLLID